MLRAMSNWRLAAKPVRATTSAVRASVAFRGYASASGDHAAWTPPSENENEGFDPVFWGRAFVIIGGTLTLIELDQLIADKWYGGKTFPERHAVYENGPTNKDWLDYKAKQYYLMKLAAHEREIMDSRSQPTIHRLINPEMIDNNSAFLRPVGYTYDTSEVKAKVPYSHKIKEYAQAYKREHGLE